jgi:3-deoxy-D-manno-octulosonate 8-phosphate phosphatase KdsC-like HAD superfamily phosphatase
MAATWTAQASVTFVATRSALALYNAGSNIIRVYRYCIFNTQTTAVTAALTTMQIRRLTALTVGTTCTPVKHDTSSSALSSVSCGSNNSTVTATDVFRKFMWLLEEAATTGTTQANWEVLIPVGIVYFPTGGDSNLEPITCRQNYGTDIYNSGSGAVSTQEFEMTFTDAAS